MKNTVAQISVPDEKPIAMCTVGELRAVIATALGQTGTDWITQTTSPLGRVRHCTAVRKRVATGKPGAAIVGRDFQLSREALQEELAAVSRKRVPPPPEKSSVADELARELKKMGAR
jgi:hypothetical protein